MKKILLLALISGLAIGANAQWHDDHQSGRETPYGNDRFDRRDNYSSIDRINRQFDEQIQSVKYDRFLSRRERRHQVRDLERQRRRALNECRRESSRAPYNGDEYSHSRGRDRDRW